VQAPEQSNIRLMNVLCNGHEDLLLFEAAVYGTVSAGRMPESSAGVETRAPRHGCFGPNLTGMELGLIELLTPLPELGGGERLPWKQTRQKQLMSELPPALTSNGSVR